MKGNRMIEKKTSKSKNKEENIYLKVIIAMIIFVIFAFLLTKSTNIVEKVLVSYETNSDIDYKVYLFPNDYIKSEYMNMGKTYIADLVSTINADFKYNIKSSKKLDSKYKYDIYAKAVVNHNSTGKELWSEEIKLVENEEVSVVDDNSINISSSVELPYNQLNTKVKMFKNQYNIPIKSYVKLTLVLRDSMTNKQIATTGLSMDLFEDTFEIQEEHANKSVNNVTESIEPNKYIIIGEAVIAGFSLLYIIYTIYRAINHLGVRKSFYAKAVHKILKNYGDIVAEVVKPVDLGNLKVIDVKNFDQMLDVEEELRIPIMFYETVRNEEGWFVLVHNDMAYRFILRNKLK